MKVSIMQLPDGKIEMLVGDEWVPATFLELEKGDAFRIVLPDGGYWTDAEGHTEFRVTEPWYLADAVPATSEPIQITFSYDYAA